MKNSAETTFTDRLKWVMKTRNLSQAALAEMAGVTQPAVSLWLNGKTAYRRSVIALCIHLDLNEDWLITGSGEPELSAEDRKKRDARRAVRKKALKGMVDEMRERGRSVTLRDPDEMTERMYSFGAASDEAWSYVDQQIESLFRAHQRDELPPKQTKASDAKIIHFPRGYQLRAVLGDIAAGLPQDAIAQADQYVALPPKLASSVDFVLRAKGDSMQEKDIFDGDLVYVNMTRKPRSGDVVAALIDHETCLKTFVAAGKEKAHLRSENKEFPSKIIPQEEMIIQGVMVGKHK